MSNTTTTICDPIEDYLRIVEDGYVRNRSCWRYVRRCFETEDIYTDKEQLQKYLSLARYLRF